MTLTDISALEQARAKLAQLSAIVESSDDAIVSQTVDGIVTSWNDGAARLYGYSADEAMMRHASFLWPSGQKEEIESALQNVRDGRPVERLNTTHVRKDGSRVEVSVTFSPILSGSQALVGISAISRDITQLVGARKEILDREERIRLLLDSTAEAIYGIDLNGACIFCNAACARLLGYEAPSALIGKQMHPLIHHTRSDGTPYPPEQSLDLRHHAPPRSRRTSTTRCCGGQTATSFPAEYWSHPIVRNDELIGAVVTFLDITERKQVEAGDSGGRQAPRAVPGDAVARTAQSAGRDSERDPAARRHRLAGRRLPRGRTGGRAAGQAHDPPARRPARRRRGSRAAASPCATSRSTCATPRDRRSRRCSR